MASADGSKFKLTGNDDSDIMLIRCETKGGDVGVVGCEGCVLCMRYIFFSSGERRCKRTSGGFTFLCTFVSRL